MEGGEKVNSTLEYFIKKFDIDTNQPNSITLGLSRYGIVEIFRELDFKTGAEIGTEHGIYAEIICKANPQLKLYCVDPWTAKPYYQGQKDQDEVDSFFETAKSRLASYNCDLFKMTSMEAVKRFEPNSLDFVFIDGDHHFEYVVNDIIHWSRIVKPGGIVYGHDYNDKYQVREAVNAYMDVSKINPWFILHKRGRITDCWMYVRQKTDTI